MDLHFLRENREQLLLKREDIRSEEMKKREAREISLLDSADVVMTVSSFEKKILADRLKKAIVLQSPIFVYDNSLNIEYDSSERYNLIFVGGFNHAPNVDAMIWFCTEIFPQIKKHIPSLILDIVGGNVPREVLALKSSNVRIHGYVSDEKLMEIYKTARLSVIPLRYGAGVKGKLVEAMYNGVPIISTGIGTEGLDGIESFVEIADSEEEFSDKVITIFDNSEQLKIMSQLGQKYVNENFSFEYAMGFLSDIFK